LVRRELAKHAAARLKPGESSLAPTSFSCYSWFAIQGFAMPQFLAHTTLLVRDYDEALAFFTDALGFSAIENTPLGDGKRWVLVAPPGSTGASLLLAEAATPEQTACIGNQTGGRVFLFLHTDDFWRDYRQMKAREVKFLEAPREEPYGTVAVFEDLYGNKWDLLEPKRTL
jgi:catechol 2,3-dioxygenase-like lactoylglutathione lyase family enzyme